MATTLAVLRAQLAALEGLYHLGVATTGGAGTFRDNVTLAHFAEANQLRGGIAYILTSTDGLAPQGQWRRITAYDQTTFQITVPANFAPAVDIGDIYELYLCPLALDEWNLCINRAILSAWPELYEREMTLMDIGGSWHYDLSKCGGLGWIDNIWIKPSTGTFDGYPSQRLVENVDYRVIGSRAAPPNDYLAFNLIRRIEPQLAMLEVDWRHSYAELATPAATTNLDPEYLMAAARAEWHSMMAGKTHGQAECTTHLQLLNYWREEAKRLKQALGVLYMTGVPLGGAQGGKGK